MLRRPSRIVLSGFSGSGKSRVAPLVAKALGWRTVDSDAVVEQQNGRTVPEIFASQGEQAFRQLETRAFRELAKERNLVISLGGGGFTRAENRRLLADGGFVVCLEARPETIVARLRAGGNPGGRPLLASDDPLARVRELKASRQATYALADATVHTDGLTPEEVASQVVALWRRYSAEQLADPGRLDAIAGSEAAATAYAGASCVVRTASRSYPVYVGWGELSSLGQRLREVGLRGRAFLISDNNVWPRHGAAASAALQEAGFETPSYLVLAGEASKSMETAAGFFDWLVGQRAERRDAIVALGGGVITDLGGYAAATFARGVPLVQVPTSLLGMVDAAIGGKVAVNHKEAKNLIGAFYQPRLVVADVATLSTLPLRELTSGWAEAIKHAFIADEGLLQTLESRTESITTLEPEVATPVIERSIAIKAEVVSIDEREEGLRTTLNYGHTLAHALEAATDYTTLLHGEAVAIGMMCAATISERMGLLPAEVVERQRALLTRFGLPVISPLVDRERVLAAMSLDKKVAAGSVRWVLLEGVGRPVIRDDVPADLVREVVTELVPAAG
ncbi:MAG TPA: 3-dehydroquinate synthase [Dehalococcoidia bacterium]|nr:3-dehydroquinate synthase [Dehalococcoidia bacterium]